MPSVLEFIGIKQQPAYTAIPQLGIHSALNALQLESQKYFTIENGAQAADGNMLAVKVIGGQNFHSTTANHIEFLNKCIEMTKEKSMQLKSIDQKIMSSVALSIAATALSFLPVVGWLGWIGWGAAIYYINQRSNAYTEYQESLKLLVGACNWSLGEGLDKRKDSIQDLTKNESIRNMMAVLYPVLTETQVKHLIADDIEDIFAKELEEYESKFQLGFNPNRLFTKKDDIIALSKKGAEFNRCIYGFNKGTVTDFLDAIVSVLPDLYRAAQHGVQQLKYWWQEKTHTPEQEEVEKSPVVKV